MNTIHKEIIVTPNQMKILEQESDKSGVSYEKLMENAGMALAFELKRVINILCCDKKLSRKPEVIFLCGNGNNAGDCFVSAILLKEMRIDSKILLLNGEPKTELAYLNFKKLKGIPIIREESEMLNILKNSFADIKVDGVFGTGFHGELPDNIKRIFEACQGFKIAADVPSGGNCKTGAVSESMLKANITVTFGGRKFGTTQYPLKEFCGDIVSVDIGIPLEVYQMLDYPIKELDDHIAKQSIPKRKADSNKGDYGRLINVCGSESMPGAAIMSACAASRCGVGLLTVCTPKQDIPQFAAKLPEAVYLPLDTSANGTYTSGAYEKICQAAEKATCVLIGCGIGVSEDSRILVKKLLLNLNCPIILDADGINCITDCIDIIRQTKSSITLTPHPAEMARLCGVTAAEIQSDRLEYSKCFAKNYHCTVILKGAGTIIASPERAYVCPTGNPGMSKGGSGDVLSGIIASFIAQNIPAYAGVYIHGKAGDNAAVKRSMQGMLPTDIIDELTGIFKEYEKE